MGELWIAQALPIRPNLRSPEYIWWPSTAQLLSAVTVSW